MRRLDVASVLGLAGSLRKDSFNRRLLEIARQVAPSSLDVGISDRLGNIPLFNEDLEGPNGEPPAAVQALRAEVSTADAILIATPEYNQSMPGVVKNIVDWLSRPAPDSAFNGKPVALCGITTGEWGTRLSQAALRQALFAAGARLLPLHLYLRKADQLFCDDDQYDEALAAQLTEFMDGVAREVILATAHARSFSPDSAGIRRDFIRNSEAVSELRIDATADGHLQAGELIARRWTGTVRHIVADDFEEHLRQAAIARFTGALGNRGALILRTDRRLSVLFETLSFWESEEALAALAHSTADVGEFRPEEHSFTLGVRGKLHLYKVKMMDVPDLLATGR